MYGAGGRARSTPRVNSRLKTDTSGEGRKQRTESVHWTDPVRCPSDDTDWFRDFVGGSRRRFDFVVLQDRVTDRYALVANIRTRIVAGGRDELSDYVLTLMTKRTA